MRQAELILLLTEWLESLPFVGGAFLGGSFGRDEADDHSDVDVYVVPYEDEDVASTLDALSKRLGEVCPILFSKTLPNARTINVVADGWLRFDLTVLDRREFVFIPRDAIKPLFDRDEKLLETIPDHPDRGSPLDAEALLDIVNEFIRVLGLSVVVKGRKDVVVAQNGTELLRGMLIRIMVLENRPRFRRGILSLKRDLTTEQYAALKALPPLEATWPSIFARTAAITREFLPRARRLVDESGAAWPEAFEHATRAHVRKKIALDT